MRVSDVVVVVTWPKLSHSLLLPLLSRSLHWMFPPLKSVPGIWTPCLSTHQQMPRLRPLEGLHCDINRKWTKQSKQSNLTMPSSKSHVFIGKKTFRQLSLPSINMLKCKTNLFALEEAFLITVGKVQRKSHDSGGVLHPLDNPIQLFSTWTLRLAYTSLTEQSGKGVRNTLQFFFTDKLINNLQCQTDVCPFRWPCSPYDPLSWV